MCEMENKKKTRAPPRNAKQYAFMVDFMVQNKHIAQHKFGASYHDKDDINNGWNTLVEELNKRGPVKTRDSWEKTWKDSKINASKKFRNLRRQRAKTGNKPLTGEICKGLNDAERKIISILGADYNRGTDISEALPESDESLRRMMNGEGVDVENALKNEGGELLATDPPQQLKTVPTNNESSEAASTPAPSASTTANNSLVLSASRIPPSTPTALVSEATKRKSSTSMDRPNAKVARCRRNREKLEAQFQEARTEFSSLQKLHVEALKVSADALMKMALNDEKRLNLEEERLHVQREQIKVMQAVCSLVEKITRK